MSEPKSTSWLCPWLQEQVIRAKEVIRNYKEEVIRNYKEEVIRNYKEEGKQQ
jgi:hypothetical protein